MSRDNEQQILWLGPLYLIGAEPLRALGCEEKEGGFEIVVEDQDGAARKRVLTPGRP